MNETHIKIGAIKYKVITEKNLVGDDGVTRLDGHIRYSASEIKLDEKLQPQARRAVTWHEVIHGILTHAGFEDHDERMIEVLTSGLMSVIQDNPWLAESVEEQ